MPFTLEKNGRCLVSSILKFVKVYEGGEVRAQFAIDELGRAWSWGENHEGYAGQGNPEYNSELSGSARNTNMYNTNILAPRLIQLADGTIKDDWVKFTGGEYSMMGMDEEGRLWACGAGGYTWDDTENCASFGLPHDSGDSYESWRGIEPDPGDKFFFWYMTRCAPSWTFKDFFHCWYYTVAIGQDDYLYFFGSDLGNGLLYPTDDYADHHVPTPTRIDFLDFKVRKMAQVGGFCYDGCACITADERLICWGWAYATYVGYDISDPAPYADITGSLSGETFKQIFVDYGGIWVLTESGNVYGRGFAWALGAEVDDDVWDEWVFIIDNIAQISISQDKRCARDNSGQLWHWGYGRFIYGTNEDDLEYTEDSIYGHDYHPVYNDSQVPVLAGYSDTIKMKDVQLDYYQSVSCGIDSADRLVAWGHNWWGPHLGNYTLFYLEWTSSELIIEAYDEEIGEQPYSVDPQPCTTPEGEITGFLGPFNTDFLEPPVQEETHFPCGHWHKREWDDEQLPEYKNNCWQPNLDVEDGKILYVVAGKFPDYEGGGYDVYMLLYNIAAREWEKQYYTYLAYSAYYPGAVKLAYPVMGYFNFNQEMAWTSTKSYWVDAQGFACWIINGDTVNYKLFPSDHHHAGKGKLTLDTTGLVFCVYRSGASTITVQKSDDYGENFTIVENITTDYDLFNIEMDANQNVYVAYFNGTNVQVRKSTDQGASWSNVGSVTGELGTEGAFFKRDGQAFTIVADNKLFISTDECATFTEVSIADPAVHLPYAYFHADQILVFVYEDMFYQYDVANEKFGSVSSTANSSDSVISLDVEKATLEQDLGVFAYVENNLTMDVSLYKAVAIFLSEDKGLHWNEYPTPFQWFKTGEQAFASKVIPFWPFQPNVSFRRTSDKFDLVEQEEKMGYMGDEFYENFSNGQVPGLTPKVYEEPEYSELEDYSEGMPPMINLDDRHTSWEYYELYYKNDLPAAGQGVVEDFVFYEKLESDVAADGRRIKFYLPPGTQKVEYELLDDGYSNYYSTIGRAPSIQVMDTTGTCTIDYLYDHNGNIRLTDEVKYPIIDEDVDSTNWVGGIWVTGITSDYLVKPLRYKITITVDTDHPHYSPTYEETEIGPSVLHSDEYTHEK